MKRNAFRLIYLFIALLCVFVCLTSCKTNPDNTSSGAEASAVDTVSDKENVNSEDVSSEETTSEPEEVASEPVEVQENTATASKTTTKKQTNSQASKTQTTQKTQQAQPIQQDTRPVNTWTCPDPSAHPGFRTALCFSESEHYRLIEVDARQTKEQEAANNERVQKAAAHGMTVEEYNSYMKGRCPFCERPFGDGHNGTCAGRLSDNGWICVNYD